MNHGQILTLKKRAVKSLSTIAPHTLDALPILQAALTLWALPADSHLRVMRSHLAHRLRTRLTPEWIQQGDVYEVFITLTALWTYDRTVTNGRHLACAITRLVAIEAAVGGPYRVPLGANACIAAFLRAVAKPLPQLDAHLQTAIEHDALDDPHLSRPALFYVLIQAGKSEALQKYGRTHPDRTPLQRSVAAAIAGTSAPASVMNEQQKNGQWAGETIIKGDQPSAIVTTAIISHALTRHYICTESPSTGAHAAIIKNVQDLFAPHGPFIHATACTLAHRICQADTAHEITLLATFFAKAFRKPLAIHASHLHTLGIASVCGWMAYMIYDDILDGEGVPAHLPVANIAMRTSFACYQKTLPSKSSFGATITATFATMDQANAWELATCRFARNGQTITIGALPRYGQGAVLADRSLAHALGPLAVLANVGAKKDTLQKTTAAFRHFLIARQLADDLHDWRKDIAAGHASFVVTAILRDMRMQPGEYRLDQLLVTMQKTFRTVTLPKICTRILYQIDTAQRVLATTNALHSTNEIYTLFNALKTVAQQGLDVHTMSNTFLQACTHGRLGTPAR